MASLPEHDNAVHQPDTRNPQVSSFSAFNITAKPPSPQMTFQVAAMHLPKDLLFNVLKEWIGRQSVVVGNNGCSNYTLSYVHPENPDPFPTLPDDILDLQKECVRQRTYDWLTDTKEFDDPMTFCFSHFLMSAKIGDNRLGFYNLSGHPFDPMAQDPNVTLTTNFPIVKDRDKQYTLFKNLTHLHGMDKLRLDFTAEQYFALFDVRVPPFHYADTNVAGDNLYPDEYAHCSGLFPAHTKQLELHFGDAYKSTNPWYNITEGGWCETNERWEYKEARLRPHVCESGLVIDWILSYAWYEGYLQPIRKIRLTGDVQEWVKEKWHDIFTRHTEYIDAHPGERVHNLAVHRPDPIELETIGMVDDDEDNDENNNNNSNDDDDDDEDEEMEDNDEAWMAKNHYPPTCACKIGCWRLRGGKIEEEVKPKTWDEFEQFEVGAEEDWMVDGELGDVEHE
ncbi:hypothetical protein G6011_06005 [Alternaria panax]|uniref:Uncharacterized protein n=1 Tax=Alternaria panax TaxID=48097 RepID=A0AAD4FG02_9PLEO|nr:hypothetical protein G6011_06005 [Alternaria panax]